MGPFSMVVAIVFIVMAATVLRERYRAHGRDGIGTGQPSADARIAQDEIRQLKERIAVLERLITDNHGSNDLSRQIDELRNR